MLRESLLLNNIQGIKGVVFNSLPATPHPLLSTVVRKSTILIVSMEISLNLNP